MLFTLPIDLLVLNSALLYFMTGVFFIISKTNKPHTIQYKIAQDETLKSNYIDVITIFIW